MKKIQSAAALGLLVGFIIAEFFPRTFKDNLGSLGDDLFGGPFSQYRNHLAWDYCLAGIVIGAVLGFVWDRMTAKGRR